MLIWFMGRLKKSLPFLILGFLLAFSIYKLRSLRASNAVRQRHPAWDTRPRHALTHPVAGVPTAEESSAPTGARHWVIVTSGSAGACDQLVIEFPQSTILFLIGPTRHPRYSHSRCQFLSDDEVTSAARKRQLPEILHASLAVACLHAMDRGAKSMYVLRGDVSADSLLPPTAHYDPHDGRHPGIVYSTNDTTLFPALTHFGCNTVRPRTNTDMEASRYAICSDTKAVVATYVQCGMSQNVAPLCDERVPGVTLQDGVFAHAQLSGAVFHEDAFWAIPLTRSEPYDDVGWTLGVQRLLWLIGKRLHVDRCTHSKRPHNSTFRQLFRDSQLANWKCTASTFKQCISDVIHHLSKARSFDGSSSGVLTLSWLVALSRFGYKFPKLVDVRSDNCRSSRPLLLHAVSHTASVSGRLIPVSNLKLIGELYNRTCRGEKVPAFSRIDLARPWMQFADVLLVVVFNNPLYSIIPHLELLYRPFFPHILYCGPTPVDRRVLAGYRVSFVAYGRTPDGHLAGAFSYRCVSLAVAAGYRVAGFLVAADDLLLQLHTLQSLSRRAPWFLPASEVRTGELRTLRECRLGMCDSFAHWVWWRDYKAATVAALAALRDSDDPRLRACHDALVRRNGAEQRPNGGFADVYYVPRHLAAHFARLADVFLRHDVFVEIAVPTVFRCVAPPGSVEALRGEALSTDATRDEVWRYFQTKYMVGKAYLHPTKWSRIATSPALNSLYCSKVLPFFHDRFARIDK